MKRQIIIRCLLPTLALLVMGTGLFEPRSLQYFMVKNGGAWAYSSLAVLSVLAVLALADVVINDMLPHEWEAEFCFKYRHLLWGGMGCTFAGYAFILLRENVGPWVAATFAVYGIGCMAVAFVDLRYRALK